VNGKEAAIKIKINPEGDIKEYVSGVPKAFIGQQFFSYNAALREAKKAEKSLPEDQSELEKAITVMSGEDDSQKYQAFLKKNNILFAGDASSNLGKFDDIGLRAYYRLADGSRIAMNKNTWSIARRDESMGYCVRVN
jgi:hypothetical protein